MISTAKQKILTTPVQSAGSNPAVYPGPDSQLGRRDGNPGGPALGYTVPSRSAAPVFAAPQLPVVGKVMEPFGQARVQRAVMVGMFASAALNAVSAGLDLAGGRRASGILFSVSAGLMATAGVIMAATYRGARRMADL